jgi:hypothetical protein
MSYDIPVPGTKDIGGIYELNSGLDWLKFLLEICVRVLG